MCVVASAYDRSSVANSLDGFGFMIPRREGLNTICMFWNSSLSAERAPQGQVLITSFAGRQLSEGFQAMSEEECAQAVEAENAKMLGITARPVDQQVWKDPQALPQYNVGHARRVAEITNILATQPNLHLAGNFLRGRSIGDCVDVGYRVAENLHSQPEGQGISPADSGSVSSPWFSALPANEKDMAAVFWVQQKFALTIASQLENLPASAARAGELDNFCDKPVMILSAGTAPEHRRKEHAAMASRLPLGD
jgi:hypothetical protein